MNRFDVQLCAFTEDGDYIGPLSPRLETKYRVGVDDPGIEQARYHIDNEPAVDVFEAPLLSPVVTPGQKLTVMLGARRDFEVGTAVTVYDDVGEPPGRNIGLTGMLELPGKHWEKPFDAKRVQRVVVPLEIQDLRQWSVLASWVGWTADRAVGVAEAVGAEPIYVASFRGLNDCHFAKTSYTLMWQQIVTIIGKAHEKSALHDKPLRIMPGSDLNLEHVYGPFRTPINPLTRFRNGYGHFFANAIADIGFKVTIYEPSVLNDGNLIADAVHNDPDVIDTSHVFSLRIDTDDAKSACENIRIATDAAGKIGRRVCIIGAGVKMRGGWLQHEVSTGDWLEALRAIRDFAIECGVESFCFTTGEPPITPFRYRRSKDVAVDLLTCEPMYSILFPPFRGPCAVARTGGAFA